MGGIASLFQATTEFIENGVLNLWLVVAISVAVSNGDDTSFVADFQCKVFRGDKHRRVIEESSCRAVSIPGISLDAGKNFTVIERGIRVTVAPRG